MSLGPPDHRLAIGGIRESLDMLVKPESSSRKRRPVLPRRLAVLLCLLALTVALFGHMEAPEGVPLATKEAVITLAHGDTPSDHEGAAISHHCVHHGHCTVHAVLPAAVPVDPLAAIRQRHSVSLLGESRVISPLRHPPKARAVF